MVRSSSQTMYVEMLMLTSKSLLTEMLYHMTTTMKLQTAIKNTVELIKQLLSTTCIHILNQDAYMN